MAAKIEKTTIIGDVLDIAPETAPLFMAIAMHHAGFFDGLAAGRRAAQAVHADGHEQRSSLRGDIQNVTDDGGFFDLCSHKK